MSLCVSHTGCEKGQPGCWLVWDTTAAAELGCCHVTRAEKVGNGVGLG